ncbi:MAG: diaminopimelate decarboxylase [Gammaproteobacteria bacterium]|nr:diaminopimelate decarboxylase [Gammaproteobacteria bacterium]
MSKARSGRAAASTSPFAHRAGALHAEDVSLVALAQRYGTPLYIYSRQAITEAFADFTRALRGTPHLLCYAVKANGTLAILQLLARLGAGFDIVSVGELERVLRAGGDAQRIVFSGVGKRDDELARALAAGIRCFNVESEAELQRLSALAVAADTPAAVAIRINPRVPVRTHPHITTGHAGAKFGVELTQAEALCRRAATLPGIRLTGVACHIGSQLTELEAFTAAAEMLVQLADRLARHAVPLEHVDFGGGFGIRYGSESPPAIADFIGRARAALGGRRLEMLLEPGRAIVGAAGILLTRVEYVKRSGHRRVLIVDAGMTELIRPPLYDAWHEVREVTPHSGVPAENCDVAGPVCESADFLARDRRLAAQPRDLLAVMTTGAYGAVMSSNYNARPRAAEVLVDGTRATLIRRRETIAELMAHEALLPE